MDDDGLIEDLRSAFHRSHEASYGFASASEPIQIVNVAVKAVGELDRPDLPTVAAMQEAAPIGTRMTLFTADERLETPIFARGALVDGQTIPGPAIVEQMDTTVLVFPGDTARVDRWGNLCIDVKGLA